MGEDASAASVALIRDRKVLLIQRAFAPYQHLWTFPGGRREPCESIESCARREISEELGLVIADLLPVLVQPLVSTSGTWRLAVFASGSFSGEITPSPEIAAHAFVPPEAVAQYRTTAGLEAIVAKAFAVLGQQC